jgi:DNA polymerase-3 subunit delta'
VGKAELARVFAMALCCPERSADDPAEPCGACRSCRAVARGGHPDVEMFSLETQAALAEKPGRGRNLSIETVRRLRSAAALLPVLGNRRILIVEDAETLLEPAQQALLKILEEPPPAVTLLLLADEPEALLPTVRSRCQEVAVRPLSEAAVARALVARGVASESAAEIAALSLGRPAWALAAAADRKLLNSRRVAWQEARDWIDASPYERLATAFKLGDQFPKRRENVFEAVRAVVAILRQAMIAAASDEGEGRAAPPEATGATVPASAWSRAVAAAMQCLSNLDGNVRPRLALEAMVLAWPNLEQRSR